MSVDFFLLAAPTIVCAEGACQYVEVWGRITQVAYILLRVRAKGINPSVATASQVAAATPGV